MVFVDEIVIYWEGDVSEIYNLDTHIFLSPDKPFVRYLVDVSPHPTLQIVDIVISDIVNRKYTYSTNPIQIRDLTRP